MPQGGFRGWWEHAARATVDATGSVWSFFAALLVIAAWALTGPVFRFSDTWQLVINTGTTVVTFLMVFLIQHSQNRDTKALHIKLNELIAAVQGASNRLIDVEDMTEDELASIHHQFQRLREKTAGGESRSVDEVPAADPPPKGKRQRRGRPS